METVYVVHQPTGPIACLLSTRPDPATQSCVGCQAYDPVNIFMCTDVAADCCNNGGDVLAKIRVYVGTRFEGETHTGRIIKNAVVHSIVEWRTHPLQVYWTDEFGKHIEPFHLTEFKKFKFL